MLHRFLSTARAHLPFSVTHKKNGERSSLLINAVFVEESRWSEEKNHFLAGGERRWKKQEQPVARFRSNDYESGVELVS